MPRRKDIFDKSENSQSMNEDSDTDCSQTSMDEDSEQEETYFELLVDKILKDDEDDDEEGTNEQDDLNEEVVEEKQEKVIFKEVVKQAKTNYNLVNVLEDDKLWLDITHKAEEMKDEMSEFEGSEDSYFEMALKYFKPHIMKIIRNKLSTDEDVDDITENEGSDADDEQSDDGGLVLQSGLGFNGRLLY